MLPTSPFARILREAAPGLSKRFFDCSGRRRADQWSKLHSVTCSGKETPRRTGFLKVHARSLRAFTNRSSQQPQIAIAAPCPSWAATANVNVHATSRFPRAFSESTRSRTGATAERDTQSNAHGKEENGAGESPEGEGKRKKSFFPDASSNTVAYWLLASAASVFGIVVFGGLTRLTESGYVLSRCPTSSFPLKSP